MQEITSFQSSTSFLTEPTPSLLQQRLQYMVERCQEWVYAIFWQASKDDHHHLLFSFADSFVNRSHHQSLDQGINTNHGIFRGSELIMSSVLRSFVPGDDLIGRTFGSGSYLWLAGDHAFQLEGSHRAKEAHLHGIKTLVCIATSWGVVEFGSSHVLKEDGDLVQLAKSLFTSETNQVQQFAQLCIGAQNGISGETKEEGRMEMMNISPTRADIPKKRGRKAKNTTTDDQVNPKYIDMERQRREKLNQRFYALRSVVPYVSKMDKASLLADAVAYISELNSKIETLTQKAESLQKNMEDVAPSSTKYMIQESEVEVRILGSEAMIRVQSPDVNHPAARLMDAMKKLEIRVHHASVSNMSDLVIQDVVAHIPKGYTMNDEEALRATILNYLQDTN